MNQQPEYYETIRQRATWHWEQLEQNPDLAGPWYQLFKQVQSPRHVLSELLQNADDAGATEASVCIENQTFIFEHNGEDFTSEHFSSLCRFGYSNKRALHTIGFRGIGFKSVFSLGDCVKLFTPSLSVSFYSKRFTEPHWLLEGMDTLGNTRVIVEIRDTHRYKEVEKNLEEWLRSPVSLLFFKNIRRLRIGIQEVNWHYRSLGPIPNSKWMALNENDDETYLLIRFDAETFPKEALEEIRQERMIDFEEEIHFPQFKIEIVLGAKGCLYVVLPTGVGTALPFACNAPFIQDPARLKIKDPGISPTNRWLLKRIGTLAASAMLRWLGQTIISTPERAAAYGLFPDVDRNDLSLEGVCSTTVIEAFGAKVEGQPLLLTENGDLTLEKQSIAIPEPLFHIWAAEQVSAILDENGRPVLCKYIEPTDRTKLLLWDIVDEVDNRKLVEILQTKHLPKPRTWHQLLNLWVYIAPEITEYRHYVYEGNVRIVPVQGKDVLYASSEVVRLGERKLLQSADDWKFLATHLIVMNQNWPRFLAEQRRAASEHNDMLATEAVETAYTVLKEINLNDTSDVNVVIDQIAANFFTQDDPSLHECVQLAQITAKLGATVSKVFKFKTSDGKMRSAKSGAMYDTDGNLRHLLPEKMREPNILHPNYTMNFPSCSREDWNHWVSSGRSGLCTFIPFVELCSYSGYRRQSLEEELNKRNFVGTVMPRYRNPWFYIQDWDFDQAYWKYWQSLEAENSGIWVSIVKRIISEKETYWSSAASAQVFERASNGFKRKLIRRDLLPSWALKLRDRPCLPDTYGVHRKPSDLLRRTPETESLIDVELFVHGSLDTEATRALLDLIGVQCTPTGPDRLLNCLRTLAKAESPPIHEVEKWYIRLDKMVNTSSTEDFEKIRRAFLFEKLILTQNGIWEVTSAVYLASNDEEIPEAEVIRPSVNHLTLWRKIGVAEWPTAELAINWLRSMPTNKSLDPGDIRRIRLLLTRYPIRIWEECGCWLNLVSEWTNVDSLSYSLTMQSLIHWQHLHPWAKQKTADLQHLSAEMTNKPPFSRLPTLATCVEDRRNSDSMISEDVKLIEWLKVLGHELSRIQLKTAEDTQRVRNLAKNLARTEMRETLCLEIIPYINGTPAGTPRKTDVLWHNHTLYVERLPNAKLARRVPEEIGKVFGLPNIKSALDYSFERSADAIKDYIAENFKLSPVRDVPTRASEEDQIHSERTMVAEGDQESGVPEEPNIEDGIKPEDNGTINLVVPDTEAGKEDNEGIETDQPRPLAKPTKPDIIERFCNLRGFRKDSNNRFYHDDGSWIAREDGALFPWVHRTALGSLVRYYLPRDHCLERKPLQLAADVWSLIEQKPDTHALVLMDIEGGPVEVTGSHLLTMRDENQFTLYPATYRLVYNSN